MWAVSKIINNTSPLANVAFADGKPINTVRGPEGACFRLIVNGHGFVDITDTEGTTFSLPFVSDIIFLL